ncbi:MAG: hypothetical protein CMI52_00880 [Parcubacteria group bacterium]|nr:hypothetical protein [Parcubacteria group bacterium]
MLVVVTGVSLMVQVYSLGYMRGDPGFARYYAYMSLFTASMIGLVLASNIVQLFVFWELVGLCSYLLIGFWYHRPAAAAAAKKAPKPKATKAKAAKKAAPAKKGNGTNGNGKDLVEKNKAALEKSGLVKPKKSKRASK